MYVPNYISTICSKHISVEDLEVSEFRRLKRIIGVQSPLENYFPQKIFTGFLSPYRCRDDKRVSRVFIIFFLFFFFVFFFCLLQFRFDVLIFAHRCRKRFSFISLPRHQSHTTQSCTSKWEKEQEGSGTRWGEWERKREGMCVRSRWCCALP